ncbi:hypothetical protein EOD42_02940 [Rhodovarius crocodyli]|uniref:Uncharacterized protein n=1 Tax=Rhodovarius crocodyli TaxID=1979269 RepID=A0A437MN62_9PROT|nr:hypothetical protein [Rhodovarius crocodyli]RVT99079.1 hypothetical protein EOD42_02940 [Rhodovarius crocodyli]
MGIAQGARRHQTQTFQAVRPIGLIRGLIDPIQGKPGDGNRTLAGAQDAHAKGDAGRARRKADGGHATPGSARRPAMAMDAMPAGGSPWGCNTQPWRTEMKSPYIDPTQIEIKEFSSRLISREKPPEETYSLSVRIDLPRTAGVMFKLKSLQLEATSASVEMITQQQALDLMLDALIETIQRERAARPPAHPSGA